MQSSKSQIVLVAYTKTKLIKKMSCPRTTTSNIYPVLQRQLPSSMLPVSSGIYVHFLKN